MHDENRLEPRVNQLEVEMAHLGGIIRGEDGEKMGIGPMVFQHDKTLNGDDGLTKRVRKLEDQALKIAVYVGVAATIATVVGQLLLKMLVKV